MTLKTKTVVLGISAVSIMAITTLFVTSCHFSHRNDSIFSNIPPADLDKVRLPKYRAAFETFFCECGYLPTDKVAFSALAERQKDCPLWEKNQVGADGDANGVGLSYQHKGAKVEIASKAAGPNYTEILDPEKIKCSKPSTDICEGGQKYLKGTFEILNTTPHKGANRSGCFLKLKYLTDEKGNKPFLQSYTAYSSTPICSFPKNSKIELELFHPSCCDENPPPKKATLVTESQIACAASLDWSVAHYIHTQDGQRMLTRYELTSFKSVTEPADQYFQRQHSMDKK